MKQFVLTALAMGLPALASAQVQAQPVSAEPAALSAQQSETCVTLMNGFPQDSLEARYVFFRLSQELAKDITPELSKIMAKYMAENETRRLPADWPMIDVIEDIADPVLRQAAPAQTVAGMAHIAYFDALCHPFVQGQVDSLLAFKPALNETDIAVREDALYLRQILVEALDRLGASDDAATEAYTASLIIERDDIEYVGFEGDIDELEALYMGDLDTKLARANDAVNESVGETGFEDAASLARDLNSAAAKRSKQERLYSLVRILGGVG
jgi:hypothetical protein